MNVRLVRANEALSNKSRLEGLIEKVITPKTGWTPQDLWNDIALERIQLWIIGDYQGMFTTNIEVRTLGRYLWVGFMSGDGYKEWIDNALKAMKEYAKAHKCKTIEYWARRGFERVPESKRLDCKHIQSLFQIEVK